VPGGPAGGHYKGFTHTQAAGTDILPQDQYEQDREDGMSSHDAVHASPRNPRGVYRSSAEVPPRPNASGAAMTYRGYQTQRDAGTSVAPGSFPAPFEETDEDAFLSRYAEHASLLEGLGLRIVGEFTDGGSVWDPIGPVGVTPGQCYPEDAMMANAHWDSTLCQWVPDAPLQDAGVLPLIRPNTIACRDYAAPPPGYYYQSRGTDANGCRILTLVPETGATSRVNQPPTTPLPLPPSPAVPVVTAPPISPRPSSVVATNQVVPLNDGSGNYVNVSTGAIVPASAVAQNPATGQLNVSSALSWLEEHSLFSSFPNWGVVAAGLLAASMFMGKHR